MEREGKGREACAGKGVGNKSIGLYQIYEALFKEGVLVAPKDFNLPAHPDLTSVRNLEVVKCMQSLTSQGFVKTQFSWQWYYYTLTPEGLDYLREVSIARAVDRSSGTQLTDPKHPLCFLIAVPPPSQRDRPRHPQEARPSSAPCQAGRCRPRRCLQGSPRR